MEGEERERRGGEEVEAFLCCNCAQLLPGVLSLQFKGVRLWWPVREREEERMEAFLCCILCTIVTRGVLSLLQLFPLVQLCTLTNQVFHLYCTWAQLQPGTLSWQLCTIQLTRPGIPSLQFKGDRGDGRM